ncbi:MAG: ribonuclease J, partial [Erysipelotrichaceae bacterium]|nr:ribonuclease J [Erysipelotrichaceae bacterium]
MNLAEKYNSRTIDRYLPTDTLIFALGGLGEIGKNTYCIQVDDEIIIIDAGIMFPDENLLGVDYVIPDYTYLIRNQEKIKGLFITHGHEDHIGGIPYLLKVVAIENIYAPKFAKALIEKKLEEHRMSGRCNVIEINNESRFTSKHFHIGFFDITHSIPDCLGLAIQTPNGWIMSTGDFKFDLTPIGSNADYQRISYMGEFGIDLLLSDSTNSAVVGFSISEKQVAKSINEIMEKTRGRLIIATFSSNVHRIQQIISAA